MRENFYNKKGHTLVFAALFIPVLLILTGLIIDGGILFLRKAQLQLMADNGASAGISIVSDLMTEIVDSKLALDPELSPPENVLTMIDDLDRISLSQSSLPRSTAETYIYENNTKNLELTEEDIAYPYNYSPGDNTLSIKITLETNHVFYFTSILNIESKEITAESISSIRIKN